MTEYVDDPALSDAANAKWREITESGRALTLSDLLGILEPNPNRPDCPAEEDDVRCELPNHHEGQHRAVVTW